MNALLLNMNAFQLATSTSNMSVSVDHLASTLVARCSLVRRLPVKAISKYVAALNTIGRDYSIASLANKNKGGARNCSAYFIFE